jgi:hypothetical protein
LSHKLRKTRKIKIWKNIYKKIKRQENQTKGKRQEGKNIVKGVTLMSVYFLKLHFYMFERSQGKHNSLNCHNFLWNIFSLITKFTSSKFDTNQKYFCMFKALKPREWIVLVFFKCFFFLPNVHHSF